MSFPRYPKYKDSGVEWLGQVPEHWEVRRIKELATIRYGLGEPPAYLAEGTPLVRATNVHAGRLVRDGMVFVDPASIPPNRVLWLQPYDIVVVRSGAYTGDSATIPEDFGPAIAGFDMVVRCLTAYPRFLQFALLSHHVQRYQIERAKMRAAQPHLNAEELGSCMVAAPPHSEQGCIVEFLQREATKIDTLIGEQRLLMELLREKRQAVISHAVTKGLNPNAPMKPSGIEWLGDIPVHWALPPLYTRYHQALGKMLDSAKITGEHPMPYLRNLDVRWDYINVDDLPVMDIAPHEIERFTVRNGDLLMVEGRELGRSAVWHGDDGVVAFQKALHRLRLIDASEHVRFFYYLMVFAHGAAVFLANQSPNEIPHLTGEQLRRYRFPKPPVHEQIAIAEYLDVETGKFDALTAEAQHAIDLLQERRTALISAAVTGQIDVRRHVGYAPVP